MLKTKGYGAKAATRSFESLEIERRECGPKDILIEILYCGVCHTDLHMARNQWKDTVYPIVPGHEILGRVKQVGKEVKNFKPGDLAMVGCIVGSCQKCPSCKGGLEQYCNEGFVFVFNRPDPLSPGRVTYGGFSNQIVVQEKYAFHYPKKFKEEQMAAAAPLLCAGITTYSPLRHWKVGKGMRVGIVGLGGLGHLAVKLGFAMGAEVVLFTTSADKIQDAKKLGASHGILSNQPEEMEKFKNSFDFILDTVAASHQLDPYFQLLKRDATLCLVGLPEHPHPSSNTGLLIEKRRNLAGSLIGGLAETQEMLDFCADHNVTADIELVPIQKINVAFERMLKSDVKYRFVIDMKSL